jgi:hypothetical protein
MQASDFLVAGLRDLRFALVLICAAALSWRCAGDDGRFLVGAGVDTRSVSGVVAQRAIGTPGLISRVFPM